MPFNSPQSLLAMVVVPVGWKKNDFKFCFTHQAPANFEFVRSRGKNGPRDDSDKICHITWYGASDEGVVPADHKLFDDVSLIALNHSCQQMGFCENKHKV